MGTYEKHLWDRILPTLQTLSELLKTEALSTYAEANTLAKQQRQTVKHTTGTASKSLLTSIALRRHAWLRAANILDDTKIEDLPFDAAGLFNSKTDDIMEFVRLVV